MTAQVRLLHSHPSPLLARVKIVIKISFQSMENIWFGQTCGFALVSGTLSLHAVAGRAFGIVAAAACAFCHNDPKG